MKHPKYTDEQLRHIYTLGSKNAKSEYSEWAWRKAKGLVEKNDKNALTGKTKSSKPKNPVVDRQRYMQIVKDIKNGMPLSKALKKNKMGNEKFTKLNREEQKLVRNPDTKRWVATYKVDIPVAGGRIIKHVRVYEPEMRVMLQYWKDVIGARSIDALQPYEGVIIQDVYGDTYTLSTDLKQAKKHYSGKQGKSFPIIS